MIGRDEVDRAITKRRPEFFAIVLLTNRRGTFKFGSPVTDFLSVEGQVMRAGLNGERLP